jgi:hypothetical protein
MFAGLGNPAAQIASAVWVRALEIARIPNRVTRQDFRDRLEHLAIAAIALDVLLAVDVAAVAAHRRVTYPPPARSDNTGLVAIGHR